MHRLVYQVFKAIMVAIILVFVFDMVGYLYRAASLNQRVESLMTSLQKVVMDNNYLPQEQAVLYQQLFGQMAADFNARSGQVYSAANPTQFFQGNSDAFVLAMDWNMYDDAVGNHPSITATRSKWTGSNWTSVSTQIVSKRMGTPMDYGDIQTIQFRVLVAQPTWGFMRTGASGSADDFTLDSSRNQHVTGSNRFTHVFTYTYYVPCMKYISQFQ